MNGDDNSTTNDESTSNATPSPVSYAAAPLTHWRFACITIMKRNKTAVCKLCAATRSDDAAHLDTFCHSNDSPLVRLLTHVVLPKLSPLRFNEPFVIKDSEELKNFPGADGTSTSARQHWFRVRGHLLKRGFAEMEFFLALISSIWNEHTTNSLELFQHFADIILDHDDTDPANESSPPDRSHENAASAEEADQGLYCDTTEESTRPLPAARRDRSRDFVRRLRDASVSLDLLLHFQMIAALAGASVELNLSIHKLVLEKYDPSNHADGICPLVQTWRIGREKEQEMFSEWLGPLDCAGLSGNADLFCALLDQQQSAGETVPELRALGSATAFCAVLGALNRQDNRTSHSRRSDDDDKEQLRSHHLYVVIDPCRWADGFLGESSVDAAIQMLDRLHLYLCNHANITGLGTDSAQSSPTNTSVHINNSSLTRSSTSASSPPRRRVATQHHQGGVGARFEDTDDLLLSIIRKGNNTTPSQLDGASSWSPLKSARISAPITDVDSWTQRLHSETMDFECLTLLDFASLVIARSFETISTIKRSPGSAGWQDSSSSVRREVSGEQMHQCDRLLGHIVRSHYAPHPSTQTLLFATTSGSLPLVRFFVEKAGLSPTAVGKLEIRRSCSVFTPVSLAAFCGFVPLLQYFVLQLPNSLSVPSERFPVEQAILAPDACGAQGELPDNAKLRTLSFLLAAPNAVAPRKQFWQRFPSAELKYDCLNEVLIAVLLATGTEPETIHELLPTSTAHLKRNCPQYVTTSRHLHDDGGLHLQTRGLNQADQRFRVHLLTAIGCSSSYDLDQACDGFKQTGTDLAAWELVLAGHKGESAPVTLLLKAMLPAELPGTLPPNTLLLPFVMLQMGCRFDDEALYCAAAGEGLPLVARLVRLGANSNANFGYHDETPYQRATNERIKEFLAKSTVARITEKDFERRPVHIPVLLALRHDSDSEHDEVRMKAWATGCCWVCLLPLFLLTLILLGVLGDGDAVEASLCVQRANGTCESFFDLCPGRWQLYADPMFPTLCPQPRRCCVPPPDPVLVPITMFNELFVVASASTPSNGTSWVDPPNPDNGTNCATVSVSSSLIQLLSSANAENQTTRQALLACCKKISRSVQPSAWWVLFQAVSGTFVTLLLNYLGSIRAAVGLTTKITALAGATRERLKRRAKKKNSTHSLMRLNSDETDAIHERNLQQDEGLDAKLISTTSLDEDEDEVEMQIAEEERLMIMHNLDQNHDEGNEQEGGAVPRDEQCTVVMHEAVTLPLLDSALLAPPSASPRPLLADPDQINPFSATDTTMQSLSTFGRLFDKEELAARRKADTEIATVPISDRCFRISSLLIVKAMLFSVATFVLIVVTTVRISTGDLTLEFAHHGKESAGTTGWQAYNTFVATLTASGVLKMFFEVTALMILNNLWKMAAHLCVIPCCCLWPCFGCCVACGSQAAVVELRTGEDPTDWYTPKLHRLVRIYYTVVLIILLPILFTHWLPAIILFAPWLLVFALCIYTTFLLISWIPATLASKCCFETIILPGFTRFFYNGCVLIGISFGGFYTTSIAINYMTLVYSTTSESEVSPYLASGEGYVRIIFDELASRSQACFVAATIESFAQSFAAFLSLL